MSLEMDIEKRLGSFTLKAAITSDKDRTALLGASGSGKSMLLKCISGIETPDEGYIKLNGRLLFDSRRKVNLKPQQRKVGYLFQNYALFPHFTVRKNIACVIKNRNDRYKVDEFLQRFDLEEVADCYADQLSGGQQQRAALARLLAVEPELLLLDEPFSALDTFLKEKIELELKALLDSYQGAAVLVTHDRNEAYRLCEKLLILEKGRLLEKGYLKEIFKAPAYLASSKLTGCKNFSSIEKINTHEVFAREWGLTLKTAQMVNKEITHIGIRAHSFYEVGSLQEENAFSATIVDSTETPFEWRHLCATVKGKEAVWWKTAKQPEAEIKHFSGFLAVAPQDIQLLK